MIWWHSELILLVPFSVTDCRVIFQSVYGCFGRVIPLPGPQLFECRQSPANAVQSQFFTEMQMLWESESALSDQGVPCEHLELQIES